MKPLHAGLLIVGAALAGGLAVKMTEPQPLPVAVAPAAAPVNRMLSPVSPPAPLAAAPVIPAPKRPSPFPDRVAPAPAPIYLEPEKAEPEKPAIRKNKPILTAKAKPDLPPLLPPVPYQPAPAARPQPQPQPAPQVPPPPAPRQATLAAGMTLQIRMNEPISSDRGVAGNTFDALLADPLVVDGLVIAERGAPVNGRIVGVVKATRFGGSSSLELELTNLTTADGQKVAITTESWTKRSEASFGATPGGESGAAPVSAMRGKPVNVPAQTIIRFRLATRVTITERRL